MLNLLTFKYWFNLRPESFVLFFKILFVSFLVLLLLAGVFFLVYKKNAKGRKVLFSRLSDFCFANLIIGALLLLFNYQQIQFFSARFWLLVWLGVIVVWLMNISKKIKKIILNREERKKEEEFKKYLP